MKILIKLITLHQGASGFCMIWSALQFYDTYLNWETCSGVALCTSASKADAPLPIMNIEQCPTLWTTAEEIEMEPSTAPEQRV